MILTEAQLEAETQRIVSATMAKFFPTAPKEAPVPVSAPSPAPANAINVVNMFRQLIDIEQFQAAAGLFGRAVATAGALLDAVPDRVGQIMLNGQRRELVAMLAYASESVQTDPDEFRATDLELMQQVMRACIADHAIRSEPRKEFFASLTNGELPPVGLSASGINWLFCR